MLGFYKDPDQPCKAQTQMPSDFLSHALIHQEQFGLCLQREDNRLSFSCIKFLP
jgi:hypothetical protein